MLGVLLMLSLLFVPVTAIAATGGIHAVSPAEGAVVSTPLTSTLEWSSVDDAAAYRVTLKEAQKGSTVAVFSSVKTPRCRIPLRPGIVYKWSVEALDSSNKVIASGGPWNFSAAEPAVKEITDPLVLFDGWHPGAHFVNIDPLPEDPNAQMSPWFWKTKYDQAPPPTFDEAKAKLPVPVWEGHQDAIDMYWYAWEVLFSVWVYPPKGEPKWVVSNLLGFPTWAGWGATMIWDSAFILQFARYADAAYPVITGLDNNYARQHENGFICRESENTNTEVNSTWPVNLPLLAWAEWSYYQSTADKERIQQVFLPLVKQYEWYMLYQRRSNGLYWSKGMGDGMDDNPRNDIAHSYLSTTSVMAQSAEILSKMADIVGRKDVAGWFAEEHDKLKKLVNDNFWDSEHNIYNDLGTNGKPITKTERGICKHAFCFWPMISGVTTASRAANLATHLSDPGSFYLPCGTGSLSKDSHGYNAEHGGYWRGSVWPCTQYMVIKGLQRCGNEGLAYQLARRYHSSFLTAFKEKGDITEFLAPEKPILYGCEKFVGWGGLAPIAILFEDIFGLRVDAHKNTITWHLRELNRHGVKNLRLGDKTVSLICEGRSSVDESFKISVESDGAFDLILKLPSGTVKKKITNGSMTFTWNGS